MDFLLLESGDYFLLEDGGKLILDAGGVGAIDYDEYKRRRKEREYLEVWNSLQEEEEAETVVLKDPTTPPVKRKPVRRAPMTADPRVRRNQQALAAVLMVI